MKKFLPLVLFVVGAVFVAGVFLATRPKKADLPEEETAPELPFELRPYTSLTPTEDSHYLNLSIKDINVATANAMDYELVYKTSDNIDQGTSGKLMLKGGDNLDQKLLLGSESSGKFRYDEGVEYGTLSLKFRDGDGKLVFKIITEFHLQKNPPEATSKDGKFSFLFDEAPESAWFVTMNTLGLPSDYEDVVKLGPYGVFSSSSNEFPGAIELDGVVVFWDNQRWSKLGDNQASNVGVFIASE